MKNISIVLLFSFLNCAWVYSQSNLEFTLSANHSIFMSNKFAGTSSGYEDFPQDWSVNLRAVSNNSALFTLSNTIGKTNWIYSVGFEKRRLKYNSTIYHIANSSGSVQAPDELVINNQMNNLLIGFGRKFYFFNKKLVFNMNIGTMLRHYKDLEVRTIKNENFIVSNIQKGDVAYEIIMEYKNYDYKWKPFINLSIGYQLTEKMIINLSLMKTEYFDVFYKQRKSSYFDNEVKPSGYVVPSYINYLKNDFKQRSNFFSLGLGVTCLLY